MDSYVYMITALLPLAAAMLVFQVNSYHALVIRGVLGATRWWFCGRGGRGNGDWALP
jgi:uncharacterized MnhB-related membrane protein